MKEKKVRNKLLIDLVSLDGAILDFTNAANALTQYSYFDLTNDGYKYFTLDLLLSNTTITVEANNAGAVEGETFEGAVTSTGLVTTLVSTALATKFTTDNDLNGLLAEIISDVSNPTNVGEKRAVKSYTAASGTIALSGALPAITTSGVTTFKLTDSPSVYGRKVSDLPTAQWADVTNQLFGAATKTTSGILIASLPTLLRRLRVKALTTNASNSCKVKLVRGI